MLPYLKLLRPLNCLMTVVAVFIGALLVVGWNFLFTSYLSLYLAMIAAFLVSGAGNVINDFADVESDKINRYKRPIPSGEVSRRSALVFAVALFFIGIFLSGFINWVTFAIALINTILLILYSYFFQHRILIGNAVISYLVGSAFLFGGAALGNIFLPFILMLLASLSNFSREIVKDLEDIEGDKKGFIKRLASKIKTHLPLERFHLGAKGVALKYANKKFHIASAVGLILAVIISPLPYVLRILSLSYLIILIPTDIVFIFSVYLLTKTSGKKGYNRLSKTIKTGMLLGLLAFIVGVLL